MRFIATRNALVVLVLVALACGGASAQCTPEWARGMFALHGLNGDVYALCVYKGELYAGGWFTVAGGTLANSIAKWDGASWQPVGAGMGGGLPSVRSLCVYNDELYAGGSFQTADGTTASRIARWNGVSWRPVGTGMGQDVYALCVHNGELYAGGRFTTAGGVTANRIAKWDGSSWQAVGTGMDESVDALCVHNGKLYAGGGFISAGGVTANHIARWTGTSWQAVGVGMNGDVDTLCVYNGELYAGGAFLSLNRIAKWNGTSWQSVSSGTNSYVWALCVYGSGLYAGGAFTSAGGTAAKHIARWNGASWQAVGQGVDGDTCPFVYAMREYDDGLGPAPALYAGGSFTQAGGNASGYIARWGCENALTDAASAKSKPEGRLVSITDDVSTAVFGDAFYVSDATNGLQVCGIRAEMPGHGVTRDKLTNVTGRTRTTADGERYIDAWSASAGASASAKPVFMWLKNLSGGPADPVGLVGQQGITGAYGLNNVGMLVRVCGRPTYVDANNFILEGSSDVAVHCVTPPGVTVSPLWQYVAVTGINSCERDGAELHRRLLVRSAEDIHLLLP